MRSPRLAGLFLILLAVLAGCGSKSSGTKSTTSSSSLGVGQACSSLSTADVQKLIGVPPKVRSLSSPPGERLDCGSMFFGQTGEIVVVVTERPGGAAALERLHKADAVQYQSATPEPAFGSGAFLAGKRVLAFRHGDTVVRIETGIKATGGGALTPAQLERLARVIDSHL